MLAIRLVAAAFALLLPAAAFAAPAREKKDLAKLGLEPASKAVEIDFGSSRTPLPLGCTPPLLPRPLAPPGARGAPTPTVAEHNTRPECPDSSRGLGRSAVDQPLAAGSLEADIDLGPTLEREALVAAVLARNPSLEAARQAHQAALERPAQARAFMDPQLTYGLAPLSVGSGSVPFGQSVEVEQMLPYPGKRRLRGEAAEAAAEVVGLGVEELRFELALATSRLYDDFVLVDRSLEVNAEHRRLMAGFLEIATARYAAGLLPQQAPLQAEVEIARLDSQRLAYERERKGVVARLNRLLHREPGASLPSPPDTGHPPVTAQIPSAQIWEQRALMERPELAAAAAEIRALEAGVELARLARRPDFGVMGSYSSMYMDTEHQWMAGVSVNLPVRRGRLRAAEAEADARVAAAEARRLALADAIRSEVRQAWDRLAEVEQVVDLYSSRLLPASRDQVQAALSAVETGRTSFLDLIEAERNLRSVELGYHAALADRNRRLAELQRLAGEMPGLPPSPADSATEDTGVASEDLGAAPGTAGLQPRGAGALPRGLGVASEDLGAAPGTAGLQPGSWAGGGEADSAAIADPAASTPSSSLLTGDSP